MRNIKLVLLGIAVFIACQVPSTAAQSETATMQAANACQPRLYTQLDFFKISSGALKNDSSTPKSIICSIDTDFGDNFTDDPNNALVVHAWISYQTNGEALPCTLYMRGRGGGSLVDSVSISLAGGSSGGRKVGRVLERVEADQSSWASYTDVYSYLQCKLPAGARVFSVDTAFESRIY